MKDGITSDRVMFPKEKFSTKSEFNDQGPVVQKVYNAIHRINRYPVDKYRQNKPRYPLDSDLSGG